MVTSPPDPQEIAALRGLVDGFIQERMQLKLDEIKGDSPEAEVKKSVLHQKYARETWLADAAKRVPQIQLASHTLKPIHPDARGTNLYVDQPVCTDANIVGTHTLQAQRADDVVANFKIGDALADGNNDTGALVTNDRGKVGQREVVRTVVVIRVAQAGSHELHLNFAKLGSAQFEVFDCPLAGQFAKHGGANLGGVLTHDGFLFLFSSTVKQTKVLVL
jgi:hypothetical protein